MLLSRLLRSCLETIHGTGFVVRELDRGSVTGRQSAVAALRGYLDGLNPGVVREIVDTLRTKKIGRLFIDGSNLGLLAAAVKRELPKVEVLTFCHNVEARFFLGSLKRNRSLRALGVLVANCVAERKAVRCSDRIIALSERDSRGFAQFYGRGATDILPMAMDDQLERERGPSSRTSGGDYALFVGGAFYANQAGITWYVDEVVPLITIRTCVVGHGMEAMRARLEQPGMVEVIGPTERLDEWYLNARVVVAPIFDGSGMKTKIAEALMFGKKIVGTSEAFSGYEDVAGQAGWVCDTADAFAAAIREVEMTQIKAFDPDLRGIYERKYSRAATLERLSRICL